MFAYPTISKIVWVDQGRYFGGDPERHAIVYPNQSGCSLRASRRGRDKGSLLSLRDRGKHVRGVS